MNSKKTTIIIEKICGKRSLSRIDKKLIVRNKWQLSYLSFLIFAIICIGQVDAISQFTNLNAFKTLYPDLTIEDFEGGPIASMVCSTILEEGNTCYPAGELQSGFSLSSSAGEDITYYPANYMALGAISPHVGVSLTDHAIFDFTATDITAVGFDLSDLENINPGLTNATYNVTIMGYDYNLGMITTLGTRSFEANGDIMFYGISTSESGDYITQLIVEGEGDVYEVFENLYWGNASSLPAAEQCHQLICPEDITMSITSETDCELSIPEEDFELPGFVSGADRVFNFTDGFEPSNWDENFYLAEGDVEHSELNLTIVGTNNPAFIDVPTWTQICIEAPCDGRFRFDWEASMTNDNDVGPCGRFNRDEPSYIINGVETVLPEDLNLNEDSGNNENVCVKAGDLFCFRVNSMNNGCKTTLSIDDFRFIYPQSINSTTLITPDEIIGDNYPPGEYEMKYEIRIPGGCRDTCSFNLKVEAFDPGGLTCQPLNLSLSDLSCTAEVTPAMTITNDVSGCLDNYVLTIDSLGHEISPILNGNHIGNYLKYKVCIPSINLCCWNTLTVEDKYPPEIECENVDVECNALHTAPVPMIISNDCGDTDLILLDSTAVQLDCHATLSGIITKTWTAVDGAGNYGNTCIQTINVLRPMLTGISAPTPYVNADALECKTFTPDENGHPTPGIDTDIPTIGVLGIPLWPMTPEFLCNVSVRYVDKVLPGGGTCTTTIVRTWEIREWHCSGEELIERPQLIQIIDRAGPDFDVPENFTVNVDMDFEEIGDVYCKGKIFLPGVENEMDNCNGIQRIDISSPHDFEIGDGITGAELLLQVGDNEIEYIAYDDCYNPRIKTMIVTVEDMREPVAICDPNPRLSLNSNGEGTLQAHDVDSGSFDECGPVTIEIAKMTDECGDLPLVFGHSVSFCCEEVGIVMVALQVTDASGNIAQCMMEVEVDNKYQPSAIIPIDTTVDCTTTFDLDDLSQFGDAQVFGSCGGSVTDNGVEEMTSCNIGKIERTFVVTNNGGGTQSYKQTIYFENLHPFDGDDEDQLSFPDDKVGADAYENICLTGNSMSQLPPSTTGEVMIVKDGCDLVGVNFTDNVLRVDNELNACYKIERQWSVIDWCQQENGQYKTWNSIQYIEVKNTIDPEILDVAIPAAEMGLVTLKSCDEQVIISTAEGITECDDVVYWEWELFNEAHVLQDAGTFLAEAGETAVAMFEVKEGQYKVEWTLRDGCSNEDVMEIQFDVVNKKLPTPYAKEITVSLGSSNTATVWIADVDNGSYHSCGYNFDLSFGCDDTSITSMTFDCGNLGDNLITLCATDEKGNQNFVSVNLVVEEGTNPCTLANVDVTGILRTVNGELMENIEVRLEGADSPSAITDVEGMYAFEDMPIGGTYTVAPGYNEDPLKGVSTLDLVMIQRHVLGTQSLTDPLQIIAADINGSESISAIDLVELRKMILGIYSEFPNNKSWQFIDSNFEFADANDPWSFGLPRDYSIDNLQVNMHIPFTGIKVGDINFSATLNASQNSVENRNGESTVIQVESMANRVSFKTSEEVDLTGLQMEMVYSGDLNNIISIESNVLGFDHSNSYVNKANSTISVSWNTAKYIRLDEGTELFYVLTKRTMDAQSIQLDQNRIVSEAYINEAVSNIELEVTDRNVERFEATIYPNPWQAKTYIDLNVVEAGIVQIELYDVAGRNIYSLSQTCVKGNQQIEINEYNIIQPGVYYCKISDGQTSIKMKMIKLR